ncbi:threonine synthase [Thoreauomyces humboldtii]|nr:threonine synthase [Thoreauomyces humboldtii]
MDPNVHNIAVEGTFDDCQDIVKAAFGDESFRTRFHLAAVNSINWARILAQTSYYFYSYFSIRKQIGGRDAAADAKIQYSVPTGNFGDVLAGYYAVRMGLPIDRLIVATNENDILHRFFQSGTYEKKKHGDLDGEVEQVKMTLSPAMDILVSSNFERLLWYLVRGDGRHVGDANEDDQDSVKRASTAIEGWMKDLKDRGGFTVPEEVHGRSKDLFTSFCTSDHLTADAIRRYHHHQYEPGSRTVVPSDRPVSYTLDPHTAVGVVAAEQILVGSPLTGTTHTLCLATASPGKFPESVLKSINDGGASEEAVRGGFVEVRYEDIAPKGLVDLAGLPKRCMTVETGGDKSVGLRKVMQAVEETVGQKFAK